MTLKAANNAERGSTPPPVQNIARTQNQGGLSNQQAQGIQQINRDNLAKGMTPEQSKAAIRANPAFGQAQAQFNAPVTPSAPVIPAPQTQTETVKVDTTPTGTTTTKTTPAPDMGAIKANADQNRQREILGVLNEGASNAPELFQSQEIFRQAYGYNEKPPEERRTLDAFYQAKSGLNQSADGLLQILGSGQQVQNRDVLNSPMYQQANSRFESVK